MLKTQITGAKYLSPQTNQMTNLNIAVPADSKDTEFGTSDILLAKDVVAYLNALDSDISKELDAQTDKINKINESIKQLIDHNLIKIVTELPTTDIDKNCIYLVPNKDGEGNNVFIEYIYVESKNTFEEVGRIQAKVDLSGYYTKEETDNLILIAKNSAINIHNEDNTKSIKLDINDTEANDNYGSLVNVSLTDGGNNIGINPGIGFMHITENGSVSRLSGRELIMRDEEFLVQVLANNITMGYDGYLAVTLEASARENVIYVGDDKFKISRPADDTEGATITGIKSLTAFTNPSATKVWATDGSTVDLATKANTSDVLLKKSASGGYYIELNSHELGLGAFAISSRCTASGMFAYAEGGATASGMVAHAEGSATASGDFSHAEGQATASGHCSHAEGTSNAAGDSSHAEGSLAKAIGEASHAEGNNTEASGANSHAEGLRTLASGYCSHALGINNVVNKNAIHSVGIGNTTTRKNAEYIYAKNNESGFDLTDDPKNGYKYLIGVGGYDGISTDNTTYKSVQEVIADLTTRIEQLETKVRALESANTPA